MDENLHELAKSIVAFFEQAEKLNNITIITHDLNE